MKRQAALRHGSSTRNLCRPALSTAVQAAASRALEASGRSAQKGPRSRGAL